MVDGSVAVFCKEQCPGQKLVGPVFYVAELSTSSAQRVRPGIKYIVES